MTKKKTPSGDWLYLVWDPVNNLVHGVHQAEEAAVGQIRKLAGQPAPHGPLHVVAAPGPTVAPGILADDLNRLPVRAQ